MCAGAQTRHQRKLAMPPGLMVLPSATITTLHAPLIDRCSPLLARCNATFLKSK